MPGTAKEETCKKLHKEEDDRTLLSMKRELKPQNKGQSSLSKRKVSKSLREGNGNVCLKRKVVNQTIVLKTKISKKQPSLSCLNDKPTGVRSKENETSDDRDVMPGKFKRRRKKRRNKLELDEASRLQRRTRYLLIKMKLEQNLIDAYSTEGWKGQSKEKIKPEKELQRAKKQILKCKLGIREAIHQLDLLSSKGCSNDSAIVSDGPIHHEHIICARCMLREALPDNDIILCDGTCNHAFHQKCLDPPLSTENIPPEDEGWFCKFCKKKMEILEATNAHLGTHFPLDSVWQDVFKEEAALPDRGNSMLYQEEEWPSDDSEDDDYDPDIIEHSCSDSMSRSESDASDYNSCFLESLEDETGNIEERSFRSIDRTLELIGAHSDEINDDEVVCRPRQRAAVDYIKLYDEMFGKNATENEISDDEEWGPMKRKRKEMFGKNATENEQISDDEEWGPTKRKRKVKETDAASTLMTLGESDKRSSEETLSELKKKQFIKKLKRPIFRLPPNAIEKLRLVFAENELPERALRVSLSKQLSLEFEKVNKWFKNARYLALKARKQAERAQVSQEVNLGIQKESLLQTAKGGHDQIDLKRNMASPDTKISKRFARRRKTHLLTYSLKRKLRRKTLFETADSNQMTMDLGDDVSLKHLREKAKEMKKKLNCKSRGRTLEAETEMERLCQIKSKVENMQQFLLRLPSWRFGKASANNLVDPSVLFVPIAELRERG